MDLRRDLCGMSLGSIHDVPFTPGDDVADIIDVPNVVVALDIPSPVVVIKISWTGMVTGRPASPGIGMFENSKRSDFDFSSCDL